MFRKPGDRSLGYAEKGKIYLNALWFAQPRVAFDAQVMKARSSAPPGYPPWHGRIGGFDHEVDRLVTHEFGHLLADTLEGYKEFASAGHAAALADPKVAVSGYAIGAKSWNDPDEWFADTFAALRLGGTGSPQVAELAAFLIRDEDEKDLPELYARHDAEKREVRKEEREEKREIRKEERLVKKEEAKKVDIEQNKKKPPHDRFVHEHPDQIEIIDDGGKPVSIEELVRRKERADKLDEAARRGDALRRRCDQDALDRCIEIVEQFVPIQEYSGQYQEICSKIDDHVIKK